MNEPRSHHTVWSKTLDPSWKEKQAAVDWMSAPGMQRYISGLIYGNQAAGREKSWLDYIRETHLEPLWRTIREDDSIREQRAGPTGGLRYLTLGAGRGKIEYAALKNGWPLGEILFSEYDASLLSAAEKTLSEFSEVSSVFRALNMDELDAVDLGQFDVIFFCHSLHHCANVTGMLRFLRRSLAPWGRLLGVDYFGPPYLQCNFRVAQILDNLFALLPPHLKANLSREGHPIDKDWRGPSFESIILGDPSEAPRSADMRELLFSTMRVIEVKPMGGTLLRRLLSNRAGNFKSESDLALLNMLKFIERRFIAENVIPSDDLFFALRR